MQLQPTTPVTIYALRDPDTGEPAYVGQTTRTLARRLTAHIHAHGTNCPRGRWITQLLAQGKRPAIVALEVTDRAHAHEREYFHIARLWADGYDLTNSAGKPRRHVPAPACAVDAAKEDAMDNDAMHDSPTNTDRPGCDPERVGISEAAELLGVHANTVRHRLKRGLYPYDKVLTPYGSAYMIPRAAIEADLVEATMGSNGAVAPSGPNGGHASVALSNAVEGALAPLVDELARARADAAQAHERAGRLEAERDAAIVERNVERTRRYELEQRRGLLRRVWAALWGESW